MSHSLAISYALASMRTGSLLDAAPPPQAMPQLSDLAATLPELFGTFDPSCLDRISERLGCDTDEGGATVFAEILLISPQHTHVIQPLAARPDIALLAVSPGTSSIGLVLAAVRAHIETMEAE